MAAAGVAARDPRFTIFLILGLGFKWIRAWPAWLGFGPVAPSFMVFLILCLGRRCLGKWDLVVLEISQYYNFFNETPAVFREGKMTRATMENIQLPIGDWVGRPTKGFIRIFK